MKNNLLVSSLSFAIITVELKRIFIDHSAEALHNLPAVGLLTMVIVAAAKFNDICIAVAHQISQLQDWMRARPRRISFQFDAEHGDKPPYGLRVDFRFGARRTQELLAGPAPQALLEAPEGAS